MEFFGWTLRRSTALTKENDDREKAARHALFQQAMQEALELAGQVPAASAHLKPSIWPSASGTKTVVWLVRREGRAPVFMQAYSGHKNENENRDRWVVFVDAQRLYLWWRWSVLSNPERKQLAERNHNRPPVFAEIEDDYKYPQQIQWSEGIKNPTWLPTLNWSAELGILFADGRTRTMWLVRNGAAVFPIEAPSADAHSLHALVGYDELKPQRLMDLWQKGWRSDAS